MKKLFALVLVVCMLSAAAFAEVVVSAANVCDAAGNVVEAAVVAVEDLENRENASAEAAARLNNGFELVKNGVAGNAGLVAAIEAAGLNANDIVVVDMFDVELGSELAEGSYVEIAVDAAPAFILFSADGIVWEVVDSFRLTQSGTFALLENRKVVITTEASEAIYENETVEGEDTIIVTEVGGSFTRSVAGKAAPEIVVVDGAVAVLTNLAGEVISSISVENSDLVITPVSERENAADLGVREGLEWAYNSILNAESVDALVAEDLGDMIVRDLFAVNVYGDLKAALADSDAAINVTFASDAGEDLVVLCSHDFATWHTIAADKVVLNGNGTVTITLEEVGAIAFAVEAEAAVDGAVVSPN